MTTLSEIFNTGDDAAILKLQTLLYVFNQERPLNNNYLLTRELIKAFLLENETVEEGMNRLLGI